MTLGLSDHGMTLIPRECVIATELGMLHDLLYDLHLVAGAWRVFVPGCPASRNTSHTSSLGQRALRMVSLVNRRKSTNDGRILKTIPVDNGAVALDILNEHLLPEPSQVLDRLQRADDIRGQTRNTASASAPYSYFPTPLK